LKWQYEMHVCTGTVACSARYRSASSG